jgi:CelD/BcsL family acetyltransferase involved in cellulose biosynthesis
MKVVELSPGDWDGLVQRSAEATLFHTNEWLTILEQTYKAQVLRLGFTEGDRLLGGIPVLVRKKFIYRIAASPSSGMATPYQGIICLDPADYGRLLQAFWSYTHTCEWDFVEVTFSPATSQLIRVSGLAHVRREQRQTITLDLSQGEERIWSGMYSECRRKIRQGERSGAVIEEAAAEDIDWVESYYRMSVDVYRRQHLPPPVPRALFENLSRVLGASREVRILFCKYEGQVVAGQIFLIHGNSLYFWDAVSKQGKRQLRASHLVQWHILRWACSHGLQICDMLGANIPRIAEFKKGYGGSFIPYSTFIHTRGFLARAGELGYRWLAPTGRRVMLLLRDFS